MMIMESLKVHLLINYYPAIGLMLGVILMGTGLRRRNAKVIRVSLKVFVAMAILTLIVVLTGEVAGWSASSYTGPHSEALEGHKIIATAAFIVTALTGTISYAGLRQMKAERENSRVKLLILIMAVASMLLVSYTVHKGRQVKWAALAGTVQNPLTDPLDREKQLWHA